MGFEYGAVIASVNYNEVIYIYMCVQRTQPWGLMFKKHALEQQKGQDLCSAIAPWFLYNCFHPLTICTPLFRFLSQLMMSVVPVGKN
jgi:hypothetical protein